jgi:hypothetical protein
MGAMVVGPTVLVSGCQDSDAVAAMDEAERLAQVAGAETDAVWTLAQTFVHCAQSIEYSMSGFPQMKSELFQHTVGAAAFNVHDLAEPIPGAPSLVDETDLEASLTRLRRSVDDFESAGGPLQPHFAYGALSQPDYALAHAMHLANHFSVIDA